MIYWTLLNHLTLLEGNILDNDPSGCGSESTLCLVNYLSTDVTQGAKNTYTKISHKITNSMDFNVPSYMICKIKLQTRKTHYMVY